MKRFIVDAMLGKLATWLRLTGHDTFYSTKVHDDELLQIALEQNRVLLTSDAILSRRAEESGAEVMLVRGTVDEEVASEQIRKLNKLKEERDNDKVREKLERLKEAARGTENLMPFIIDAVRDYTSIGEIIDALKEVFGTYHEDSIF